MRSTKTFSTEKNQFFHGCFLDLARPIGVCQDFAHIMLSVLRPAGIPPAVCGYIRNCAAKRGKRREAEKTDRFGSNRCMGRGSGPGATLDCPRSHHNRWCGEQHISVSFGRDASEASPIRGTFKGSGEQSLRVQVKVIRLKK